MNKNDGGPAVNRCVRFPGGIMTLSPKTEFSDEEVEAMRGVLARRWQVRKNQVTDYEAIAVMEKERGE